jgi:Cu/Ag efflux protein CusF
MKPTFFALAFAGLLTFPALAQQTKADDHAAHHPASAPSPSGELTDGEVRKVDKEAGKLTLKHGEIKSLDMPGMTMVFAVKDKAMLDRLQPGDKVRFKAINDNGKFTLTEVVPAK